MLLEFVLDGARRGRRGVRRCGVRQWPARERPRDKPADQECRAQERGNDDGTASGIASLLFVRGLPRVQCGETNIMASGDAAVDSPFAAPSHRVRFHPVIVAGEVAVAGYVALAVFALALGALLMNVLVDGWLGQFDHDVVHSMAGSRTPTWDTLTAIGSNLAGGITVPIVVFVILVVCAAFRNWTLFGLFAVASVLEPLTYLTATYFIVRTRPDVPRLESLIVSDSFFSGHTAAAVMLYGTIAIAVFTRTRNRVVRAIVVAVAVVVPVVVALSRMYRGMHYPTDALSGALVGLGCIAVAVVAVRRAERMT